MDYQQQLNQQIEKILAILGDSPQDFEYELKEATGVARDASASASKMCQNLLLRSDKLALTEQGLRMRYAESKEEKLLAPIDELVEAREELFAVAAELENVAEHCSNLEDAFTELASSERLYGDLLEAATDARFLQQQVERGR